MKKYCFVYFLLALLIFSCNPALGDFKDNKPHVVKLENGLYYVPLSFNVSTDSARAIAMPDFSAEKLKIDHYTVSLTNAEGDSFNFVLSAETADGIQVDAGDYTVTAIAYKDDGTACYVSKESKNFNPDINTNGLEIAMVPFALIANFSGISKYKGKVRLVLKLPKQETGKPGTYYLKMNDLYYESDCYLAHRYTDNTFSTVASNNEIILSTSEETEVYFGINDVPPGSYNITFCVSERSTFDPAKNIAETLVVYAGMESSMWRKGNTDYTSLSYTHDELHVDDYSDWAFWVKGSQDCIFTSESDVASSIGKTYVEKCDSIQSVINCINKLNPGNQEMLVILDGTFYENLSVGETLIDFDLNNKPNIRIKGYRQYDQAATINLITGGKILDIKKVGNLTFENVEFCDGNNASNDGVICINAQSSFDIKSVVFDSCYFTDCQMNMSYPAICIKNNTKSVTLKNCEHSNIDLPYDMYLSDLSNNEVLHIDGYNKTASYSFKIYSSSDKIVLDNNFNINSKIVIEPHLAGTSPSDFIAYKMQNSTQNQTAFNQIINQESGVKSLSPDYEFQSNSDTDWLYAKLKSLVQSPGVSFTVGTHAVNISLTNGTTEYTSTQLYALSINNDFDLNLKITVDGEDKTSAYLGSCTATVKSPYTGADSGSSFDNTTGSITLENGWAPDSYCVEIELTIDGISVLQRIDFRVIE